MTQSTVYLCRHADPDNPRGVFYGHLPGFGLGERGRRQARGLGQWLADKSIGQVYVSPLQRARETAQLAAAGITPTPPEAVRQELLETRFGLYIQGIRRPEVVFRRPLFFLHLLRPGLLTIDESVGELAARVLKVCTEAALATPGGAALVVSHSDPIKALWNRHLGRADWRFHSLKLDKGSSLELRFEDGTLKSAVYHPPREATQEEG
ncbi:MAG: histidine phosphatase family protein [Candidatus Dormibacteria bacterium]